MLSSRSWFSVWGSYESGKLNFGALLRGRTFSKSLVFQAISNVVVIGHDIFALLLCQFFNLGPHPPKLLFRFFTFFGPNKPTGRKCCSGIMSNFLNFLNLFWHYYLIGNIQDHFGAIQTPSRHHPDIHRHPQTPRNSPPFLVENGPLGESRIRWNKDTYSSFFNCFSIDILQT